MSRPLRNLSAPVPTNRRWRGIAYDEAGAGDPVVLIHGFMFNRTMWQSQVEMLSAEGRRVITVDLPGFGASNLPNLPTTMSSYSDAVFTVLDHAAIEATVLVGYSMGGQVIMDFAARHADMVTGIMLVDTVPEADTAQRAVARRQLSTRLERDGVQDYVEEFLPQLIRLDSASPDLRDRTRAMMLATDPAGAAAASRARANRPSYYDTLRQLDVPALVVLGEHDPFDSGDSAQTMARLLPRGNWVQMRGVGHTPPMEDPTTFNRILRDFVTAAVADCR